MGFFSRSYDKPGKGVDPDAPQKRSFFRFFDIFWRKIGKFFQLNLIYTLTLIPTAIIIFLAGEVVVAKLAETVGFGIDELSTLLVLGSLIFLNLFISMWGAGPATAGITYVMRNYSREEHAWVWTDFKDSIKDNFKQAIVVFLIDIVMLMLFYVGLIYYSQPGSAMGVLRYIMYAIMLIYTMMHLYIYPLLVTFKLSLADIYRNAFLFAIGKLPSNIFILLVLFLIHAVIPAFVILICGQHIVAALCVVYVAECVITQSFSSFLVNFNAYAKIKRYMLDVAESDDSSIA